MTDDLINSTAGHRKMLHGKRSFSMARHTHLDSPAYDASEEDNDPLTDDGGSTMSVPASRTHHANAPPSSSTAASGSNVPTGSASRAQLFQMKRTQPHAYQSHSHPHTHHASRITAILSSDIDEGIDSPTYDGDVESSSTAVAKDTDVLSSSGTPLASPILSTSNELRHMSTLTLTSSQYHSEDLASDTPRIVEPPNITLGNPTASDQVAFHPATSTEEEIQSWVKETIHNSNTYRSFSINLPSLGRPLRQAKLSFPSVYLMVGVCSDELVRLHKANTAMNHAERCESVRNCRWVDQVIPEAPWVIDQSFIDKWAIDYIAHDDEPYSSIDHDDVYAYVKSQERIVSYYRLGIFDAKLEKSGHGELKAQHSNYDLDNCQQ
ncbi:hypothetical protein Clacol_008232 [Clathrus columnatus]|uniref:choline-phosphate cytidylyltransferase n=1 Tax=Clathrus columnatus TaxID=1419009 RepID=A0AAV5APZ9_9AGAM|nr:hypothetical protein Clacol_008232 [Clathrus columnatus]